MPFRLWYYACKAVPIVFAAFVLGLFQPRGSVLATVGAAATGLFILLGIMGAAMGLLGLFGRLRMKCPFCGRPSKVGGTRRQGMYLVCDTCGFVHGSGFYGLTLTREPHEDDEDTDQG